MAHIFQDLQACRLQTTLEASFFSFLEASTLFLEKQIMPCHLPTSMGSHL